MMEVSVRIRRAIHLNDLVLLKRIIKNNPRLLQNQDLEENGNTSLHLAAKLGLIKIAVSQVFFSFFFLLSFVFTFNYCIIFSILKQVPYT